MSYYRTCQICGARLDPGERCDCDQEPKQTKREEEKECKKTA